VGSLATAFQRLHCMAVAQRQVKLESNVCRNCSCVGKYSLIYVSFIRRSNLMRCLTGIHGSNS
jgi:hypothetical protein